MKDWIFHALPDFSSTNSIKLQGEGNVLSSGVSKKEAEYLRNFEVRHTLSFDYAFFNRGNFLEVLDFYNDKKGKLYPFWLPTWTSQLVMEEDILQLGSSDFVDVKDANYRDYIDEFPVLRHVFLYSEEIGMYVCRVDSVSTYENTEGDTIERLHFPSDIGYHFKSFNTIIGFVLPVTFSADQAKFQCFSDGHVKVSFGFKQEFFISENLPFFSCELVFAQDDISADFEEDVLDPVELPELLAKLTELGISIVFDEDLKIKLSQLGIEILGEPGPPPTSLNQLGIEQIPEEAKTDLSQLGVEHNYKDFKPEVSPALELPFEEDIPINMEPSLELNLDNSKQAELKPSIEMPFEESKTSGPPELGIEWASSDPPNESAEFSVAVEFSSKPLFSSGDLSIEVDWNQRNKAETEASNEIVYGSNEQESSSLTIEKSFGETKAFGSLFGTETAFKDVVSSRIKVSESIEFEELFSNSALVASSYVYSDSSIVSNTALGGENVYGEAISTGSTTSIETSFDDNVGFESNLAVETSFKSNLGIHFSGSIETSFESNPSIGSKLGVEYSSKEDVGFGSAVGSEMLFDSSEGSYSFLGSSLVFSEEKYTHSKQIGSESAYSEPFPDSMGLSIETTYDFSSESAFTSYGYSLMFSEEGKNNLSLSQEFIFSSNPARALFSPEITFSRNGNHFSSSISPEFAYTREPSHKTFQIGSEFAYTRKYPYRTEEVSSESAFSSNPSFTASAISAETMSSRDPAEISVISHSAEFRELVSNSGILSSAFIFSSSNSTAVESMVAELSMDSGEKTNLEAYNFSIVFSDNKSSGGELAAEHTYTDIYGIKIEHAIEETFQSAFSSKFHYAFSYMYDNSAGSKTVLGSEVSYSDKSNNFVKLSKPAREYNYTENFGYSIRQFSEETLFSQDSFSYLSIAGRESVYEESSQRLSNVKILGISEEAAYETNLDYEDKQLGLEYSYEITKRFLATGVGMELNSLGNSGLGPRIGEVGVELVTNAPNSSGLTIKQKQHVYLATGFNSWWNSLPFSDDYSDHNDYPLYAAELFDGNLQFIQSRVSTVNNVPYTNEKGGVFNGVGLRTGESNISSYDDDPELFRVYLTESDNFVNGVSLSFDYYVRPVQNVDTRRASNVSIGFTSILKLINDPNAPINPGPNQNFFLDHEERDLYWKVITFRGFRIGIIFSKPDNGYDVTVQLYDINDNVIASNFYAGGNSDLRWGVHQKWIHVDLQATNTDIYFKIGPYELSYTEPSGVAYNDTEPISFYAHNDNYAGRKVKKFFGPGGNDFTWDFTYFAEPRQYITNLLVVNNVLDDALAPPAHARLVSNNAKDGENIGWKKSNQLTSETVQNVIKDGDDKESIEVVSESEEGSFVSMVLEEIDESKFNDIMAFNVLVDNLVRPRDLGLKLVLVSKRTEVFEKKVVLGNFGESVLLKDETNLLPYSVSELNEDFEVGFESFFT